MYLPLCFLNCCLAAVYAISQSFWYEILFTNCSYTENIYIVLICAAFVFQVLRTKESCLYWQKRKQQGREAIKDNFELSNFSKFTEESIILCKDNTRDLHTGPKKLSIIRKIMYCFKNLFCIKIFFCFFHRFLQLSLNAKSFLCFHSGMSQTSRISY